MLCSTIAASSGLESIYVGKPFSSVELKKLLAHHAATLKKLDAMFLKEDTFLGITMPNLRVVRARGAAFTGKDLYDIMKGAPRVETLHISSCSRLYDQSLKNIPHYWPALKELQVHAAPDDPVSSEGFLSFTALSRLTHLDVGGNVITDSLLSTLAASLRWLENVGVSSPNVTDVGAIALADANRYDFVESCIACVAS